MGCAEDTYCDIDCASLSLCIVYAGDRQRGAGKLVVVHGVVTSS